MNMGTQYLDPENRRKLEALENASVLEITERYLELLKPEKATVITDDPQDILYVSWARRCV